MALQATRQGAGSVMTSTVQTVCSEVWVMVMSNVLGYIRRANGTRMHMQAMEHGEIGLLHISGAVVDFYATTPKQLHCRGYRILRATPSVWQLWAQAIYGESL
jgi:hypothetical protein